ncbi:hypothetical protein UC35_06505 [Ramlibacter tataouinensis]|uniref:Uncharacterized protein n=1 Tax=Ramlibacter tataouinensis TaxID=94132 RepID=A0A127JRK2_9BURK|nr:hypothetical protein UC35_06505 [Ramlibacter tataouinensis]
MRLPLGVMSEEIQPPPLGLLSAVQVWPPSRDTLSTYALSDPPTAASAISTSPVASDETLVMGLYAIHGYQYAGPPWYGVPQDQLDVSRACHTVPSGAVPFMPDVRMLWPAFCAMAQSHEVLVALIVTVSLRLASAGKVSVTVARFGPTTSWMGAVTL